VLHFLVPNSVFALRYAAFQGICGLPGPPNSQETEGWRVHRDQPRRPRDRVHAALLEEIALEDRINDEVRAILEAYSDEMLKSGANYQEMFKKVKNELVRKYKAVL
jgi:hypothetical protein